MSTDVTGYLAEIEDLRNDRDAAREEARKARAECERLREALRPLIRALSMDVPESSATRHAEIVRVARAALAKTSA